MMFVTDCLSRAIVGWHASIIKMSPLVAAALRMGPWRRDRDGHSAGDGLIHHGDARSQAHERIVRGSTRTRGHRRVDRVSWRCV